MTYKAPIKIAFLVPHLGRSGAETTLEQLLLQLPQNLFEAYLIAPHKQPLVAIAHNIGLFTYIRKFPEFHSTSIEIGDHRVSNPFAIIYNLSILLLLAWQLNRWLRKNHVQILYSISMFGHLTCALASIGTQCKLVWHVHEILSSSFGRIVLGCFAYCFVDEIITPSHAVATSILFKKNIKIVPNGIDIKKYANTQNSKLRQELETSSDIPIIGMIGRLTPWKGQRLFIEAIAKLYKAGLNGHFIIVGDTIFGNRDYRAELQDLSKALQVDDQISFLGFREDIPNILKGLDIVVVPSVRPEPFGLIAVEAMASGKPVIGSNAGGLVDIIVHEQTGLLFKMGDVSELVQAIEKLMHSPELRLQYSQAGFERARQEYTVERYASQSTQLLIHIADKAT